ncbi:telomere binding protein [Saxophila tyrrhenica]|uniref:Telomere binding protein n=1 Tax=Saxophila tyrrhenica TaxID=1690608 RepID=A0AAV9PIB1_9PEZI|nr:telomere binding protein [Saxophila tyrrhenica]
MADFLTAVKSLRSQNRADEDLKAERSTDSNTGPSNKASESEKQARVETKRLASSPQDALDILRSQPDLDELRSVLKSLHSNTFCPTFSIHSPGPLQAQIINTILAQTVPDFWSVLAKQAANSVAEVLRNVAGLNAIVARLRMVLSKTSVEGGQDRSLALTDLINIAGHVLHGDETLLRVHRNLSGAVLNQTKRDMAWKEGVSLMGSGKVLATLAEAEDAVNEKGGLDVTVREFTSGADYAAWLGRNIATLASSADVGKVGDAHDTVPASQVLAKALNFGYPHRLLAALLEPLAMQIRTQPGQKAVLTSMLCHLPSHSKRLFVEHLLRWLSTIDGSEDATPLPGSAEQAKVVATTASLLSSIAAVDSALKQNIASSLTDPARSGLQSFAVRRACIAALSAVSGDLDVLQLVTERVMSAFNDFLFIAHGPIIQQEAMAQTLLLTAGYLHRKAPMALLMTARSSSHMQGVSNRLDTSNARGRWLGMVVGTAISSLVDKEGMKMSFGTEDMETEEAKWYMNLARVEDQVGRLADLQSLLTTPKQPSKRRQRAGRGQAPEKMLEINGKPTFGPPRPPAQTEVIGEKVTELLDGDEDGDEDDLKPYAQPDSDPEDSDEDATLVNRKKTRPPVYIRDLMAMLRDEQDHDRFQLGIKHAASLIRRKTEFGSEVKDHANELGIILCNLRDPFETDEFDSLKLQAMIAVILSDVKAMAPWFCKQAFSGDYSVSQRCIMLSALGLSGRELAGFKNEDEPNPSQGVPDFPSKRLPPRLHGIYNQPATTTKRLEAASNDVEQALIKPLALHAADQSTAHLNAVKVRTFSSRMDVERTKRKPTANALAKVFGESYFFPLVNRYQQEIAAYGSASVYSSMPFVLVTFVKTVALLHHASGPATLSLSELSGEFWDLLLSLRVQATQDISVLHAVLFSLLTVLEMNTDKRQVVNDHPKRLMETQQWVDMVFGWVGGNEMVSEGGNDEETKVRTLAAGVLVKCREIIGAYQKELVGFSMD